MKRSATIAILMFVLFAVSKSFFGQGAQSEVRVIVKGAAKPMESNGYTLTRNGQPFFIKGAGGASRYLDQAAADGANSIREWSPDETTLDSARRLGLTVLLGLVVGIPRHGFDYHDGKAVQRQLDETVALVHRLKTNPAVLIWALGNEVELAATTEQRITAWKALEQLARAVKHEDPAHPVIVVLAGAGDNKLRELDQYCPSLDAVGINVYGAIISLPETIAAQGFRRPYIVTEFGPRGHWEVAKTAWGMPIEDTSTQKAKLIEQGYEHAIANHPQCLGSYVFLWGQKQEKTQTWYGLFLPDGAHVGGVDVMQYLWTGNWPAHRVPVIDGNILAKPEDSDSETAEDVFRPGARIVCSIKTSDPDGDRLTTKWELRPDVANNPSSGGDFEPSTAPISGAIERENGQSAVIRVPNTPGDYRIFVYVYNQYKGAATANLPIEVK